MTNSPLSPLLKRILTSVGYHLHSAAGRISDRGPKHAADSIRSRIQSILEKEAQIATSINSKSKKVSPATVGLSPQLLESTTRHSRGQHFNYIFTGTDRHASDRSALYARLCDFLGWDIAETVARVEGPDGPGYAWRYRETMQFPMVRRAPHTELSLPARYGIESQQGAVLDRALEHECRTPLDVRETIDGHFRLEDNHLILSKHGEPPHSALVELWGNRILSPQVLKPIDELTWSAFHQLTKGLKIEEKSLQSAFDELKIILRNGKIVIPE